MLLNKNAIKKYIDDKFAYSYRGKKYNIIIIIILSVLFSRMIMYGLYLLEKGETVNILEFINSMSKWDSGWYRSIILDGYNLFPSGHPKGDAANWAFFPLYPLIIKLIYFIIPVDPYIIGGIISTIFFTIALIISYLYIVETRKNKNKALIFVILMTFGIYSFYFSILYTEALYLLLLVSSLYFLHKQKYILFGIFGALASATRSLGVMLVFAAAVQYTISYLNSENKTFKGYISNAFKDSELIFGIALIPSGLFAYMSYLWWKIGDPMAFSRIEIAWGKHFSNPMKILANAFLSRNKYDIFMAICAMGAIGITVYLFIKKRWVESILAFIFILIPLSTGVQSIPRYMIGSFVYMIGFIDILNEFKRKYLIYLMVLVFSIGELFMLIAWFRGSALLC